MSFLTDGKGVPMDDPACPLWFHGSPALLTALAAGSAMTRNKRLAEAFSHKPTLLAFASDGTIRHNGMRDGYLYQIDEPIGEGDAEVHPGIMQTDAWEWTTRRELKLKLLGKTTVQPSQRIGRLEAATMRIGTRLALLVRRNRG